MKPETYVDRIIANEDGECLKVGPWDESPNAVCLQPEGSEEYYGKLSLTISPDTAIELGFALIACAREIKTT